MNSVLKKSALVDLILVKDTISLSTLRICSYCCKVIYPPPRHE